MEEKIFVFRTVNLYKLYVKIGIVPIASLVFYFIFGKSILFIGLMCLWLFLSGMALVLFNKVFLDKTTNVSIRPFDLTLNGENIDLKKIDCYELLLNYASDLQIIKLVVENKPLRISSFSSIENDELDFNKFKQELFSTLNKNNVPRANGLASIRFSIIALYVLFIPLLYYGYSKGILITNKVILLFVFWIGLLVGMHIFYERKKNKPK